MWCTGDLNVNDNMDKWRSEKPTFLQNIAKVSSSYAQHKFPQTLLVTFPILMFSFQSSMLKHEPQTIEGNLNLWALYD